MLSGPDVVDSKLQEPEMIEGGFSHQSLRCLSFIITHTYIHICKSYVPNSMSSWHWSLRTVDCIQYTLLQYH